MRFVLVAALSLAACNRDSIPGGSDDLAGVGGDLGGVVDFAARADLAGFCGDPGSPRIELNGMRADSPAVAASWLPLSCCDAVSVEWDSMQVATSITLVWRHQVGQ